MKIKYENKVKCYKLKRVCCCSVSTSLPTSSDIRHQIYVPSSLLYKYFYCFYSLKHLSVTKHTKLILFIVRDNRTKFFYKRCVLLTDVTSALKSVVVNCE